MSTSLALSIVSVLNYRSDDFSVSKYRLSIDTFIRSVDRTMLGIHHLYPREPLGIKLTMSNHCKRYHISFATIFLNGTSELLSLTRIANSQSKEKRFEFIFIFVIENYKNP